MATPTDRRIQVQCFIEIVDEGTPISVPGASLEEYDNAPRTADNNVVQYSDATDFIFEANESIPDSGSPVDGWSSYWNPRVTYNNCDMLFNVDGPTGDGFAGKMFTDHRIIDTSGWHSLFASNPLNNASHHDLLYLKALGDIEYTGNMNIAGGQHNKDYEVKANQHCFQLWSGRNWNAGHTTILARAETGGPTEASIEFIAGIRKE